MTHQFRSSIVVLTKIDGRQRAVCHVIRMLWVFSVAESCQSKEGYEGDLISLGINRFIWFVS